MEGLGPRFAILPALAVILGNFVIAALFHQRVVGPRFTPGASTGALVAREFARLKTPRQASGPT